MIERIAMIEGIERQIRVIERIEGRNGKIHIE